MIGNGIFAYGQLTNKITPSSSIISYCLIPPVYSSPLWRQDTAGICHLLDNRRFPPSSLTDTDFVLIGTATD